MIRRTAIVFLGSLIVSAIVAPAWGQVITAPTSVTASYESPNFVGTVSSPNPECVPGRQVTLFERQIGGGAEAVGGTTTGADGSFSIPQPGADGQYHVTVSSRQLPGGDYDEGQFCQGAQSGMVPAGSGVLGGSDVDDDDDGIAGDGDAAVPFTGTQGVVGLSVLSLVLIGLGLILVRRNRRGTA